MFQTDKSDILVFAPGKYSVISWGATKKLHFSGDSTHSVGSVFKNHVGSALDYGAGARMTWSGSTVLNHATSDTVHYHLRSHFLIGRNTAFKQTSYFLATSGFDPAMSDKVASQFKEIKSQEERFKIPNKLLTVLGLAYQLLGYWDSGIKAIKQPNQQWTDWTRDKMERGTSAIAFTLSSLQSLYSFSNMNYMWRGKWKSLVRDDYQPDAIIQTAKNKGVFLGAQFQEGSNQNKRTIAAVHLDSTIRLQSSSLEASKASDIFYPRDVQDQKSITWYEQLSPEKFITQLKNKAGTEPVEYASFNGFKGQVDSSIELSPQSIDVISSNITNLSSVLKVTAATLDFVRVQQAIARVKEVQRKVDSAANQAQELLRMSASADIQTTLTPEELVLAPLVAAAGSADLVQRGILVAQANSILALLGEELAAATVLKVEAEMALMSPNSKNKSELSLSSERFELKTNGANNKKAAITGSSGGLNLTHNTNTGESLLALNGKEVLIAQDKYSGVVLGKRSASMCAGDAYVELKSNNLTLSGGGGCIKMKNNSVTIGDLKISNLSAGTALDELTKTKKDVDAVMEKFKKFESDIETKLKDKDAEIEKLKNDLAKKADKFKFKDSWF